MSKIDKIASSFARRDQLKDIEEKVQQKWDELRIFEKDAPEQFDKESRDKFLVTFPYPYMNGLMHIGHAFTVTKCEFAAGYKSLKGSDILFPFGFHCTGMPISAAALKLKRELEGEKQDLADASSMKSKVAAKTGGLTQAAILRGMGVPKEEIPKFIDPSYWLQYFPPLAQKDLKRFGLRVDWRRSFITTDINPFYDSFIRWQFNSLKAQNKVKKGLRYTIYSPMDDQPCADHDRASGEGVVPQEYSIIKMRVQTPFPKCMSVLEGRNVFLAAATLRPETMYGQTNCWILPEGEYGAYELNNGDVLVMAERAARNLSYQNKTKVPKQAPSLATFKGTDLIGLPLSAPNSSFETIYTLPMMTILMTKGTGIVTSVPSDSPDDYAVLRDLKNKEKLREKFGVKDEWVLPFEPVPIIDIPELGQNAAEKMVLKLKIKSQNDRKKLDEAKKEVYQKGFYSGKLIVGPYAGQNIIDVKDKIKAEMIENGNALVYYEPEGMVVSRSGDECVVALAEQWYLAYGEDAWRKTVQEHIDKMEFYSSSTKHQFQKTIEWLKEWACSRSFGLGTKLPFDPDWLIDSLSDSTIYMAYYTVCHLLHGGSLDGSSSPNGIKPEHMTDAVWDYIFRAGGYPEGCAIGEETLKKLRNEFEYWYPVDLRVSGKDLIQNHLTMFLYNHAAMFVQEKWPGSIYTNGHVVVNSEKMSKSKGNFFTMHECIENYSADATRFALADAGDGMDDANFVEETANSAILRFTTLFGFVEQLKTNPELYATEGELEFSDHAFISRINKCIQETDANYASMLFREALKTGYFDMQQALSNYRTETEGRGMRQDLVERFLEVQALLLSPITPHVSEHMWSLLGKEGTIMKARWPQVGEVDEIILQQHDFLRASIHEFNSKLNKARKNFESDKPISVYIFCCTGYLPWQLETIRAVREVYQEAGEIPKNIAKTLGSIPSLKKMMKNVMPFVAYLKEQVSRYGSRALNDDLPFSEVELIQENAELFKSQLGVESVHVFGDSPDAPHREKTRKTSSPGNPAVAFVQE